MIVEFIGTPGSGKTTLLPTVIDGLHEQGIQAFTVVAAARPFARRTLAGRLIGRLAPASLQDPLLWRLFIVYSIGYRLRFMAAHPRLIGYVIYTQRRRPHAADVRQRKILYWFFRMVGQYEFLRSHAGTDEALIVDEGFIHRVVQLNASGVEEPNPTQIAAYVDRLPQPDLVIHVDAPAPVCAERIYQRGLWQRMQHKEPAEIAQFVVNAHAVVHVAVSCIKRRGWRVIHIANHDDDPSTAQETLRNELTLVGEFRSVQSKQVVGALGETT